MRMKIKENNEANSYTEVSRAVKPISTRMSWWPPTPPSSGSSGTQDCPAPPPPPPPPRTSSGAGGAPLVCRRCSWQGKVVNCSEIFTPVITDMGVCCAFNTKTDILKDSTYKGLVEEMQVGDGLGSIFLGCEGRKHQRGDDGAPG